MRKHQPHQRCPALHQIEALFISLIFLVFPGYFLSGQTPAVPKAAGNNLKNSNILQNGGFENGLATPWGTGLYSNGQTIWWNSGGCLSTAEADESMVKSGIASLHLINPSIRFPHVFGTMAQRVPVRKGQWYRLTLWAKGYNLASRSTVSIVVDPEWKMRPIIFPAGTFSWKKIEGTFSLQADYADIRILIEDAGEAWIDDMQLVPMEGHFLNTTPPAVSSPIK